MGFPQMQRVVVVVGLLVTIITTTRTQQPEPNYVRRPENPLTAATASVVDDTDRKHNKLKDDPPKIPSITIGTDVHGLPVQMPLLGAGTWQYNDTVAYQSVCQSFEAGYTMVDTAFGYHNQKGVGKALHDCWKGKHRADLFVLTKLPGGLSYQETLAHHAQNLFALNIEFVDHLMVHFPADWQVTKASRAIRQEQWRAMQEIWYSGKARSIGVSHYCAAHLQDILDMADIVPSLNQVEYHVGSGDIDAVRDFGRQHGVTYMSFSPLCGPCQYEPADSLITGDLVTSIGKKYNKTGSQVSLRFIVQQALKEQANGTMAGVIPKSNNPDHIAQNMDIFDWSLSQEDMDKLHAATQPAAEAGDCDVP
eukprot:scaffold34638_cov161-Amphora_coffeaeformis.AAC.11